MNAAVRVACTAAIVLMFAYLSLRITVRVPLFVLLLLAASGLTAAVFAFRRPQRLLMPGARTVEPAPRGPVEPPAPAIEPSPPPWRFDDEEPW